MEEINNNIKINFKDNQEVVQDQSQKIFTEEEYNVLNNKYLTAVADLDNYRKRTQREYATIINNANKDLIVDLLCVIDDMERLLKTSGNEGFKLIYNKFIQILESEGCYKLETKIGDKFNVLFHEAILARHTDNEDKKDTISNIFQYGWKLNNTLLRPSKVEVFN